MRLTKTDTFTGYRQWIKNGGHYSQDSLVHLARAMSEDAGNVKSDGSGRWRPSLIGDPCDRVQQLSRRFAKDPEGNWYAWSGTLLHLGFQAYLLDTWPGHISIEVPVLADRSGAPGVTGKMDWCWDGDDGYDGMSPILGPHIGDYKTIVSIKRVAEAPKPEHVEQIGYELFTLGLDVGYLVYQDRTHGAMVSWLLEPSLHDLDRWGERLARLDAKEATGELFPMLTECRALKGAYRTCDFANICLREEVGSDDDDFGAKPGWEGEGPPG